MPPIRAFLEEQPEIDGGFVKVVVLDLQQPEALPGFVEEHFGSRIIIRLVLGDQLLEDRLGLCISAVVSAVTTHVQQRLARPGTVGKVLDVFPEERHTDNSLV